MLESIVNFLSDCGLVSAYIKLAVVLYIALYVIEEVLGLPIIGPIPSTVTHAELKKFVQGICEDIVNLPSTLDFSGVSGRKPEPLPFFDPKKYEQLLATAVLNKMTDFYQNDKNSQNNSSGVHSDAELDSNHNQLNGKAVIDLMVQRSEAGQQMHAPTIERLNSKAADDESHLSDYVQNHYVPLPDLSASDSANDDVDVQSVASSNGTDGTWEDNWLFKKRKLKTESQPIAMLVPSPTEEIKALIGDTAADETSDLSENSDAEDDVHKETFTNTLLIAAKPAEAAVTLPEVSSVTIRPAATDSLKSMQSLTSLDNDDSGVITEARNNLLLISDETSEQVKPIEFDLNGSVTRELSVIVEKATDAEEEFDSIVSPGQVREHKTSIDEQFEKLLMDDNNNNAVDMAASAAFLSLLSPEKNEIVVESPAPTPVTAQTKPDPEKVLMANVVPGSFAEREHIKWLHAAPIANNPYSTEALQRRLSEPEQKHKALNINNTKLVDALVEESNAVEAEKGESEVDFRPKQVDMRKYKRDYYINDPTESQKRHSYASSTSKSPSFDAEDEVSEENFKRDLPNQHHAREFLLEKLLNSKGGDTDTASVTSRISRDSSERDFSLPKEIVRQLESQMLHSDLKRESFRSRNGTKHFCLNPLFEENFAQKSDEVENKSKLVEESQNGPKRLPFPSTVSSFSSLEEMKANCVENIFLDLDRVRRSGSVRSVDSDQLSFAAERCHSLKRRERKLK